jgi:hypothetical protein
MDLILEGLFIFFVIVTTPFTLFQLVLIVRNRKVLNKKIPPPNLAGVY